MTTTPGSNRPRAARRVRAALALAVAVAALSPASALAGSAGLSGGELSFVGGGEVNAVSVTWVEGYWLVEDSSAPVLAGAGCSAGSTTKVFCPSAGVTSLAVEAGDGNDSVTNFSFLPATIHGGAGNDAVYGGGAADTLTGGSGSDQLYGSWGDDSLDGGPGADLLDGSLGKDTAVYASRTAAVSVTPNGTADDGESGEGDNVHSDVEGAQLGAGNDSYAGGDAANTVLGGPGDDSLDGAGGNDTLDGGDGKDAYSGGAGADMMRTRDSSGESVDCGADADTALSDPGDSLSGCEQADVSTAELPPAGGDGDGGADGGGSGAGGGAGGGSLPDGPDPIEGLRLLNPASVALVVTPAGAVSLRVECPADAIGGCRGTITLALVDASGRVVSARRNKARKRRRVGRRRFNVPPGRSTTIRVRISRRGRRVIKNRKRRIRLRATIATLGADGTTATTQRTLRVRASRRGGAKKRR